MAADKKAIMADIAKKKKQGKSNNEIWQSLGSVANQLEARFAESGSSDPKADAMAVFGLKPEGTLWEKTKSRAESAYVGIAKKGAGVVQGVAWLGDRANEGINKVFGTNLSTDAYEQYTQSVQDVINEKERYRKEVGRDGADWVEAGAGMVASAPYYVLGKGAGSKAGLGTRMVEQGIRGAVDGATSYASNAKERLANIGLGTVGGAGGELVGAALTKGSTKTYNAIKGRKTATATAIEKLGKKHKVRTSVGDIKGGVVVKNAETQLERVPAVGMGKFRQVQQAEAKTAATAVAKKLSDNLDSTNYKALPQIQKAANAGDRNAKRIMTVVDNAKTPDEVLQASLEVRAWREKSVAGKLYDQVADEIGKVANQTIAPTHTKKMITDKLALERGSLAPDDGLVRELDTILSRLDDPAVTKNFNNMRLLRSQLGDLADKYANGANANMSASRFVGDLRQAVEKDISEWVANSGNAKIQTAYQRADSYYKAMTARQEKSLAKAMKTSTPDQIYHQFIKASQGDKANNFYRALDQKGQAAVRYKMVEEAIDKATNPSTGVFSPAKFAGEFERLREPYSQLFSGASKREMDGFVKLMRHVERAGQFAENPPTGVRLTDVAMVGGTVAAPALMMKVGGVALMAKTLLTTKAGKRLLLAANDLPANAKGLSNILNLTEKMAGSAGANLAMASNDMADNEADTMYSDKAGNTGQDTGDLQNSQGYQLSPLTEYDTTADPSKIGLTPPSVEDYGGFDMPSGGYADDVYADADEVPTPDEPPATEEAPPPIDVVIGQTLTGIIPPPQDINNPQKMQVYQAVAGRVVGAVLDSPPMQMMMNELSSPQPDEQKLMAMQQELSKTPEWQQFVQMLPKETHEQMSGADILALITQNSYHSDDVVLAPQF